MDAIPGKTKVVDTVGTFDINSVRPGRYFFSPSTETMNATQSRERG